MLDATVTRVSERNRAHNVLWGGDTADAGQELLFPLALPSYFVASGAVTRIGSATSSVT